LLFVFVVRDALFRGPSGEQQAGPIHRQTGLLIQAPSEPFLIVSQRSKGVKRVKIRKLESVQE
jgi:hypothetical protein